MMIINVNGAATYCYTGGKAFDAAKPTIVFIHGVLCDHSVWILQSRYLAHHGWNVLSIDLPGHCKSSGIAPASVEDAAIFIEAFMDAAGVDKAALVGHSFGSLIALQAAANLKDRVTHLVLVGTAYPMKVSQMLLDAALNEPAKGIQMINVFSRSTLAAPPSALGPGTWVYGISQALNHRVQASNKEVNLFYRGFNACNSYAGGEAAIAAITCPVLFLLGSMDQMTLPAAAQDLIKRATQAGKSVRTAMLPVGHHQMFETPEQTLFEIRAFLSA
jgi:pimeloyl-ACP methyl ester carboxylesterase